MDDEIDLIEYINVIWKRRWLIFCIIIITTVVTGVVSFMLPPLYEAETSFIIKKGTNNSGSLSALLGQNIPSALSMFSARNVALDDTKNIIKSHLIAEKVAKDLDLATRWMPLKDNETISLYEIAELLRGTVSLAKPEYGSNIIVLKVQDRNPELARDIANRYVQEVFAYYRNLTFKDILQRKQFIDNQLPGVEAKLKQIENKYKNFAQLLPSGVRSAGLKSIEGIRLSRELEIQNNLYILLKKEQETVKLELAKISDSFLILDKAVKPKLPIRPQKKLNVLLALMLSGILGITLAFFFEYYPSLSQRLKS